MKYIKLYLTGNKDDSTYEAQYDDEPRDLFFLGELVTKVVPQVITEFFYEIFFDYDSDEIELSWFLESNSVIIKRINCCMSYPGCCKGDFFIMKFDNFKKMIEDWAGLVEKRAPEIYFIMNNRGEIVVRDCLEE